MKNLRILAFACLVISNSLITGLEDQNYNGYRVVSITPETGDQFSRVQSFKDPDNTIEILKYSRGIDDALEILVPPEKLDFIEDFLSLNNLPFQLVSDDFQRTLEETIPQRRSIGFGLTKYNSYDDIQTYLTYLATNYPNLVKLEYQGDSYEGRPMNLVRISVDPFANNPQIFVDAGVHAREWVAPATALYLIHTLVEDPKGKAMLNGVDWLILPVVNPDGYEYTRKSPSTRMWRKTRSQSRNGCFGADGNRNYGFKWAVVGISRDPCNKETYPGAQPFSEVETRIVRKIMLSNPRIKLYISLHSYGQYLVYPWGFTDKLLPQNWKKLNALATLASNAVVRAGGPKFNVMSAGQWYPAAGGSDDFAYGAAKIPYAYTMELTDGYNFIYPEHLLEKTLPIYMPAFAEFAHQIGYEYESSGLRNYY